MIKDIFDQVREKVKLCDDHILNGKIEDWPSYRYVVGCRVAYNDVLDVIRQIVEDERAKQNKDDKPNEA